MTIYNWLIVALWFLLVATWVASAGHAKLTIGGGRAWRREIALRLVILISVLLALRLLVLSYGLRNVGHYAVNRSPIMGLIGVAFCAAGVGLAVLARFYLGRNWGMPMSQKENPELVTTGPYAIVRHPIYMGMLLAMLGSAIGQSIFWMLPLVLCGPYFIYSARREEKLMAEQFPEQYPGYMKRTKMLLPYVL
jgi:protein-S-isoprenylcysteine O-methyltransferase Ste14